MWFFCFCFFFYSKRLDDSLPWSISVLNYTVISSDQWVLAHVLIPSGHICPHLHSFTINTFWWWWLFGTCARLLKDVHVCEWVFFSLFSENWHSFDDVKITISFFTSTHACRFTLSHFTFVFLPLVFLLVHLSLRDVADCNYTPTYLQGHKGNFV